MTDSIFQIGAPGIDTDKIVAEIKETVARKTKEGVYNDPRIARAERANLSSLKNEDEFLTFYLECLRDAVFVDINDFEIIERRNGISRVLVGIKRFVWKLLKFYTYRLWSQQNQVNGLLLAVVEGLESRHRDNTERLEKRIAKLEAAANGSS